MRALRTAVLAACLVALPAAAGSAPGVVVQDAPLRAQPGTGAEAVARLERGDAVILGDRAGGWIAVRTRSTPQRHGWMRVWHVRAQRADETAQSGNPLLAGLARFSRAVTGLFDAGGKPEVNEGRTTATFGVRGLDSGDIEHAAPNPAGLKRLVAARVTPADANAHAHAEHLQRRKATVPGAGVSGAENWGGW